MVGLTQRVMAQIAKVTPPTISKCIAQNDIKPVDVKNLRNMRYDIGDVRTVLRHCIGKDLQIFKPVMAFYNFKGGVGKTSICFQISSHLAMMGFKVLVVDADPQGHLTTSFGLSNEHEYLTLYDIIEHQMSPKEVIQPIFQGLDLVPSNLSLTRIEVSLNELPKREERIKIAFDPLKKDYDFILFDTNPSISHLNRNVIVFSDLLNIIVETQAYSINGLKLLMNDLDRFFQSMVMQKPEIFIIPNRYEDRTSTSVEAITLLREFYGEYMIENFAFRKSEDINISAKTSQPLAVFCRKNSIALEDVLDVLYYILFKTTDLEL